MSELRERQTERFCPDCQQMKSLDSFYNNKRKPDGKDWRCKDCHKRARRESYQRNRLNNILSARIWQAKNPERVREIKRRHYRRHPEVEIYSRLKYKQRYNGGELMSRQEFYDWYRKQPQVCHYCDIPRDYVWINNTQRGLMHLRLDSFSIDRKDNGRGYTLDNVVLACFLCNALKSHYFSEDEMRDIAQRYIKPKWEVVASNKEGSRCLLGKN